MKHGLLNGQERLILPDGDYVQVASLVEPEGSWSRSAVTLRKGEKRGWEATIVDLWGDPTSNARSSVAVDFRCFHWSAKGLFIIAGDNKAVVVNAETGVILGEQVLEFTGKASLDILSIFANRSDDTVVVFSTYLAVGIRGDGAIAWTWRPRWFPKDVISDVESFVVEQYDLNDPKSKIVSQRVNIRTGKEEV